MDPRALLQQWFGQLPGSSLAAVEADWLAAELPGLFGYHALQLGQSVGIDLLAASRIGHRAVLAFDPLSMAVPLRPALIGRCENLPLAADSIDVLLLPHVLEFESNPHQILRECERVLIGEGHLLILSFNPWSLWGLSRLLLGWRGESPWHGHYFSAARLQDWLRLLGFEIVQSQKLYFRPPIAHAGSLRKLEFVERLGAGCWPWWGGVSALIARKRVLSQTPVRELWRHRRRLIAAGVAEPSARRTTTGINRFG